MNSTEQLNLFRLPPVVPSPKARHIMIGARIVPYVLRQGRRRRLSMTIDERGLAVGAPRSITLAEIEAFICGHGPWVIEKLDEHAARAVPRQITVRHGTRLPLLGGEIEISVEVGANRIIWQGDRLVLAARPGADLDLLARRALQRRALPHFVDRATHYAAALGCALPNVGLSSARTRWGSCSRHGGIRLNWRLIHLSTHLVDYVVAHELAHLDEMNHSPRFWAVVERVYPDWKTARGELKRRGREMPIV